MPRGSYLSPAPTESLNRIRRSFVSSESSTTLALWMREEEVMKFSEYLDLFVMLCRLILYFVEFWKARRANGENSGS